MRLFEHEDFGPILTEATQWLQAEKGLERISAQIVEKDYYVTEILRIAASTFGDAIVFKGGTSLSKGWELIHRFSEDVDLFLNPARFTPPLGESRIRRKLEELKDAANEHPGLTWLSNDTKADNKVRADVFAFQPAYQENPGIPASVLMEAGVRSGAHPCIQVELTSYVADFLKSRGLDRIADDLQSFPMTLLHFKRTFVEKMFTVYSKVEIMLSHGESNLGDAARHYYDLAQLMRQPEVHELLSSPIEMAEIVDDYYAITQKFFKHSPLPESRRLNDSRSHFPDADLRPQLASAYADQCAKLCYSEYPAFDEVLGEFERIRELI